MMLSDREVAIYKLLSRLRGIAMPQLLAAFWPNSASGRINGKRWVAERVSRGLCDSFGAQGRPCERVELVYTGGPNSEPPDFGALSRESVRRWESVPPIPLEIVRATSRLRHIMGESDIRFRAIDQIAHDVATAMIYVTLLNTSPGLVDGWINEEDAPDPAYKEAKADAMLLDEDGRIVRAIEFCSGYAAEKFAKIDRTFRSYNIPYDLYMRADACSLSRPISS